MNQELRQMIIDRDEVAFEEAFFDNRCSDFFWVDWREDDEDIVQYCADCLGLDSMTAEWRDDDLFLMFDGDEVKVSLQMDVGDRHLTVCAINDLLHPKHEIRFIVISHGSDSVCFAALSTTDWQALEKANATAVAENFIDPRELPNLMTELTDATLPADARARFQRMIERNKNG